MQKTVSKCSRHAGKREKSRSIRSNWGTRTMERVGRGVSPGWITARKSSSPGGQTFWVILPGFTFILVQIWAEESGSPGTDTTQTHPSPPLHCAPYPAHKMRRDPQECTGKTQLVPRRYAEVGGKCTENAQSAKRIYRRCYKYA